MFFLRPRCILLHLAQPFSYLHQLLQNIKAKQHVDNLNRLKITLIAWSYIDL